MANIPSGVTESEVVENLRKYGPFEYISSDHLTAGARLKPDSFYQASTGGCECLLLQAGINMTMAELYSGCDIPYSGG